MSAETREALVQALREHVGDEVDGGGYLTDFIIIAASPMAEDADLTTYITESSDGPPHHRLGLTRYLVRRAEDIIFGDG